MHLAVDPFLTGSLELPVRLRRENWQSSPDRFVEFEAASLGQRLPSFLRVASWIGGDRGHTGATACMIGKRK